MAVLVRFISDNAAWFYGSCAVLALFLLFLASAARRERLQAVFTLERETAEKKQARLLWGAIGIMALLALLFAANLVMT